MALKIFAINTASGTWVVPDDWNNAVNSIEGIGHGGFSVSDGSATAAGGGGGGAYARSNNITLVPGSTLHFFTMYSGNFPSGYWVSWNGNTQPTSATTGLLVTSGGVVSTGQAAGGLGGLSTSCIGQIRYSGGNGGTGSIQVGTGGGGGGAAGPGGAGKNGGNGDSSAAGADCGGGGGGAGGGSSSAGSNGTTVPGVGGNGPSGIGGGTTTVDATVGGGGVGGTVDLPGGEGAPGVDICTVTEATPGFPIGTVIGAGGGGGGSGPAGSGAGSGAATFGGGGGGSSDQFGSSVNGNAVIVFSYEPILPPPLESSTGSMFMMFN